MKFTKQNHNSHKLKLLLLITYKNDLALLKLTQL